MAQNIPTVVADVELQVASAIGVGTTSFTLASATDDDGNALTAGKYCFTIDNGKSNKEYLIGQLNGTAVTSVVSVSRQGVESAGASQKHRIGASCIITDFATIQRVADTLRGIVALNGATPVVYDTEPALSDRKELATVGYVLDTVTGGTVSFDTQTVTGNAGEAVTDGDLVYFKTSDQEWYLTDADTASTVEGVLLGIALGTGSDGVAITGGVLTNGLYTTTGLTAGSEYYASNTAGAYSTSAGTTSRKIGLALSTTKLFVYASNPTTVTSNEKDALAGGGDLGTPSATNKYITQDYTKTKIPVTTIYATQTAYGVANSQFDILNTTGSTYRYTWDGTGTNPDINSTNFPVGAWVTIWSANFNAANKGTFQITGSGTNYFEVTNDAGVAETNKTCGFVGTLVVGQKTTWTKPSGLAFVVVEVVGGGASGCGGSNDTNDYTGGGGGGGGYSRKTIAVGDLGATEDIIVGVGGGRSYGATSSPDYQKSGGTSSFGEHLSATGGQARSSGNYELGTIGGIGTGGDINIPGTPGENGDIITKASYSGAGGNSVLGAGGLGSLYTAVGNAGRGYGGGGSGGPTATVNFSGDGAVGAVIVTEYYS